MPLTPLDIHNREFRRSFRGYDPDEVDDFLDQVVKEFESLLAESAQLKERAEDLEEELGRYRAMEATLRDSLVLATRTAEEVKAAAQKEAEALLEEARARVRQLEEEAAHRVRAMEQRQEEIRNQLRLLWARARGAIQSQLELLDQEGKYLTAPLLEPPAGEGGEA
ncbi:MAG: DivIVA domain-containing protein [Acetobacteraceae bacterium]|nr:DivIVA domain-containing protein [Acetobacteraceae bacterium]